MMLTLKRMTNAAFGALALLGLICPAGAAAPVVAQPLPSGTATPQTTALQKSLLLQMQDAFTQIAEAVEPTVVNIKAERPVPASGEMEPGGGDGSLPGPRLPGKMKQHAPPRRLQATGSGVIVRSDGYILTNEHVVDSAAGGMVTVTLSDGREFPGKVYPDYKSDLAIVKIDPGTQKLPVAQFADAERVVPGQWALAVGSPFDLQNTLTVGIISAVNRHQRINGDGDERYYPDLIQTDAAINPGNSGGPLFNIDGQVVGINVAIESPVDSSAGVGFAIPVKIARQIANTLIAHGKVIRGYLGLTPEDLTPAMQAQYGQSTGAFVRDLAIGSPADKAGLQAADIITTYNGKPIRSELDLREEIANTLPAQQVSIGYLRDNAAAIATATVDPAPALAGDSVPASPAQPQLPRQSLGITVRRLTVQDRQSLNLPVSTQGVMVTTVTSGSIAEAHGLTPGMIIQKVNHTQVISKVAFDKAITELFSSLTLIILRPDMANNQLYQHAITLYL